MKTILILHGWTYSTDKWEPFVKALTNVGYEVKLLKIPGLTARLEHPWTIDEYIKWLDSIIKKEKKRVILLGHSNGGRIILSYVLKYPDAVDHIILLDSAGIYHKDLPLAFKRFVFHNLARLKTIIPSNILRNLLYKVAREQDYNRASPIMKQTMRNLIATDLLLSLPIIHIPTTIIWGEHDTTTPVSDGKQMNRMIKSSTLHIISEARHSPQFTHPNEVVDIIKHKV